MLGGPARIRLHFDDGTSLVLTEGETLKCFTATRIVRWEPCLPAELENQLRMQQSAMRQHR
jgi:hypothetical protein